MKKKVFSIALGFGFTLVFNACLNANYSQGKSLYLSNCANCHGNNGEGLGDLYPPLKNVDYLKNHQEKLACIIKYGLNGEILVNNKSYNQAMPGLKHLSEIEINNIINYLLSELNDGNAYQSLSETTTHLKNCD